MAAQLDLIENTRISLDKSGYRVDRIALVTSVTGSADERLFNAINDPALPNYGDVHPVISSIYLNDLSAEVIDPETVRVTLSYYDDPSTESGTGNATVRASATTVVEEVKFDINGDPLKTQYTVSSGVVDHEPFTAEVERARVTWDFEFTSSTFPQADINAYLGKINSAAWNGYAVQTILCTAINVSQQGDDFNIRYSFAYNEDTWVFEARTKSQPIGDHPVNVDTSLDTTTGRRPFDVYETADFTPLGFAL